MKAAVPVAVLLLALARVAAAQATAREVRGRIFETADSTRPVVGAEIELSRIVERNDCLAKFQSDACAAIVIWTKSY